MNSFPSPLQQNHLCFSNMISRLQELDDNTQKENVLNQIKPYKLFLDAQNTPDQINSLKNCQIELFSSALKLGTQFLQDSCKLIQTTQFYWNVMQFPRVKDLQTFQESLRKKYIQYSHHLTNQLDILSNNVENESMQTEIEETNINQIKQKIILVQTFLEETLEKGTQKRGMWEYGNAVREFLDRIFEEDYAGCYFIAEDRSDMFAFDSAAIGIAFFFHRLLQPQPGTGKLFYNIFSLPKIAYISFGGESNPLTEDVMNWNIFDQLSSCSSLMSIIIKKSSKNDESQDYTLNSSDLQSKYIPSQRRSNSYHINLDEEMTSKEILSMFEKLLKPLLKQFNPVMIVFNHNLKVEQQSCDLNPSNFSQEYQFQSSNKNIDHSVISPKEFASLIQNLGSICNQKVLVLSQLKVPEETLQMNSNEIPITKAPKQTRKSNTKQNQMKLQNLENMNLKQAGKGRRSSSSKRNIQDSTNKKRKMNSNIENEQGIEINLDKNNFQDSIITFNGKLLLLNIVRYLQMACKLFEEKEVSSQQQAIIKSEQLQSLPQLPSNEGEQKQEQIQPSSQNEQPPPQKESQQFFQNTLFFTQTKSMKYALEKEGFEDEKDEKRRNEILKLKQNIMEQLESLIKANSTDDIILQPFKKQQDIHQESSYFISNLSNIQNQQREQQISNLLTREFELYPNTIVMKGVLYLLTKQIYFLERVSQFKLNAAYISQMMVATGYGLSEQIDMSSLNCNQSNYSHSKSIFKIEKDLFNNDKNQLNSQLSEIKDNTEQSQNELELMNENIIKEELLTKDKSNLDEKSPNNSLVSVSTVPASIQDIIELKALRIKQACKLKQIKYFPQVIQSNSQEYHSPKSNYKISSKGSNSVLNMKIEYSNPPLSISEKAKILQKKIIESKQTSCSVFDLRKNKKIQLRSAKDGKLIFYNESVSQIQIVYSEANLLEIYIFNIKLRGHFYHLCLTEMPSTQMGQTLAAPLFQENLIVPSCDIRIESSLTFDSQFIYKVFGRELKNQRQQVSNQVIEVINRQNKQISLLKAEGEIKIQSQYGFSSATFSVNQNIRYLTIFGGFDSQSREVTQTALLQISSMTFSCIECLQKSDYFQTQIINKKQREGSNRFQNGQNLIDNRQNPNNMHVYWSKVPRIFSLSQSIYDEFSDTLFVLGGIRLWEKSICLAKFNKVKQLVSMSQVSFSKFEVDSIKSTDYSKNNISINFRSNMYGIQKPIGSLSSQLINCEYGKITDLEQSAELSTNYLNNNALLFQSQVSANNCNTNNINNNGNSLTIKCVNSTSLNSQNARSSQQEIFQVMQLDFEDRLLSIPRIAIKMFS